MLEVFSKAVLAESGAEGFGSGEMPESLRHSQVTPLAASVTLAERSVAA